MSRDGTAFLALALGLFTLLGPGRSVAGKLTPVDGPESVPIEIAGRVYQYFPLSADRPLVVETDGPVVFEAILRWRFEGPSAPVDVEVEFTLDGSASWHHIFRTRPGDFRYPTLPGAIPGRSGRFTLGLRSGRHVVEARLVTPREGVLDVNALARDPSVLPWRMEWRGELGTTYDSNIFRYADSDVDDFLDGRREDRFPSETLDDLRIEPAIDALFVREEPGRRTTKLSFGADLKLTTVNTEKTFGKLAVGVREERPGVAFVSAAYSVIPRYHIRTLWDADAGDGEGEYRACEFRKHAVRLEAGSARSLPIDVAGFLKFESYGYDPDFVEYDADAVTAGVRGTVRPVSGLRLDVAYALRRLEARGYDEYGESRISSDDSDTTYDQDEYGFRVRWEAGEWWGCPAVVSARAKLKERFYLTEKSGADDPYHAGREDTYWIVGVVALLRLTEAVGLEGFVEHRGRSVRSPFVEDIGERKDYNATRAGLTVILEGVRFLD